MTNIVIENDLRLDKNVFKNPETMFVYFMKHKLFSPTEIWYLYKEELDEDTYKEYLSRLDTNIDDFIDVTNE